ncbi:hypothetical protein B0T21DRAFT_278055 [Apiosordaria backusii]|uniref:Uncharacterized protein n=1 Tax=Apiosordaria backusii TaxID=314023 RepID=A0AA40K625_9PEZI|nr:hypothetical protein B0T21DRAFT_278055 [Apiosordaria backusii]
MTIKTGDRMLLDGPYGQDLHLYRYETVILTAKGMGIVSVLPMALHLAARKAYDDSVRSQSKLDEDSTARAQRQDKWVADQLKALQELDPRGVILLV